MQPIYNYWWNTLGSFVLMKGERPIESYNEVMAHNIYMCQVATMNSIVLSILLLVTRIKTTGHLLFDFVSFHHVDDGGSKNWL